MEGLLPIWKQAGMTSHDVVFNLRRLLGIKKIGHAGTLDPDVDGVLPVAIGKATKVLEFMVNTPKAYSGTITLGYSTTTEDASGECVERQLVNPSLLNLQQIDTALEQFQGMITQIPPMYSAVKVNGKRLYEYARAGESVERPKRQVRIDDFRRTSDVAYHDGVATFSFYVMCGKGTYVRTLAVDLGRALGLPSHMSQLTRVLSAGFQQSDALTLDEVEALVDKQQIHQVLQPLEKGLKHLPTVVLTAHQWQKVQHGQVMLTSTFQCTDDLIVLYYGDRAVALYETHPTKPGWMKPKKVLKTEI